MKFSTVASTSFTTWLGCCSLTLLAAAAASSSSFFLLPMVSGFVLVKDSSFTRTTAATATASGHPFCPFLGSNPTVSRGTTTTATSTVAVTAVARVQAQEEYNDQDHEKDTGAQMPSPPPPETMTHNRQPKRREMILSMLRCTAGSAATMSSTLAFSLISSKRPAWANDETSTSSSSSLLEQFGTDPTKITQKSTLDDSSSRGGGGPVVAKPKAESIIEPNLRSNYYYPTNKKRYLPRIKKCNDAIPDAAEAIGTGNWDVAEEFVNKIADDTILPLKLYTSSLTGGGTNVKVSFTKDMFKAADDFEKAQKELVKAVKKRDRQASSSALEALSTALSAYREAGRLTGPDAGGDIPSVDEIRRSACRVQGRTFEQKVKARDARLAEAMAAAAAAAGNEK